MTVTLSGPPGSFTLATEPLTSRTGIVAVLKNFADLPFGQHFPQPVSARAQPVSGLQAYFRDVGASASTCPAHNIRYEVAQPMMRCLLGSHLACPHQLLQQRIVMRQTTKLARFVPRAGRNAVGGSSG